MSPPGKQSIMMANDMYCGNAGKHAMSKRLRSLTIADSLEDINFLDLSSLILKDRSASTIMYSSTPNILSCGGDDLHWRPHDYQGEKKKGRFLAPTFLKYVRKKLSLSKGRRKDKDSPTPPTPEDQKEYLEDPNTKDRISDADFFKLVALPPSLDLHEWMATHTISLFNHVNLIYGVVSQYCTPDTCPAMTAPDNVQYFWHDDKGKKSKNTACQYIDYSMAHIEQLINDETVFPTKFGNPFPADVEAVIKRIHKYLFQVVAHIYHAHYHLLHQLGLHAHLNTLFTHFMVFTSKFDLIQGKDSDILLNLFSLLLKNLADPSQNPQLRQELEDKEVAKKEKQRQYEESSSKSEDNNGEESMDTSCSNGGGDIPHSQSSSSSSSPCVVGVGAGDNHHHHRCGCDNNYHDKFCDSNKDNNSSSSSPSPYEQREHNGTVVHSQQPLPTSSLSSSSSSSSPHHHNTLIPPSDNSIRGGGGGESDGSKPPTDWLGGMQISAT